MPHILLALGGGGGGGRRRAVAVATRYARYQLESERTARHATGPVWRFADATPRARRREARGGLGARGSDAARSWSAMSAVMLALIAAASLRTLSNCRRQLTYAFE